ncbi:DUF6838 family protein [Rummeliibacillus sp. NPDC094406]|uniref:phage tail terminator family protein n=1 Tax=Rummeliibacillus sp. NPDC094406 TaxID=3364511 RepID=UPI00380C3186
MITTKDLKKAINDRINNKFSDIEINSNDVKEGFSRPSFFVQLDGRKSSTMEHVDKDIDVQIYYFPSNEYNHAIELMDTQEILESAFDLKLRVVNRWLNITETNAVITDGVLNMSFSLEFNDARNIEEDSNWIEREFPDAEGKGPGKDHFDKYPVELMEELEMILKE